MRKVSICLTPELLPLHGEISERIVIIIDIFRATSTIISALANGVSAIKPVLSVDECLANKQEGYLTAGERKGIKIPEFDLGNSPLAYLNRTFEGRKVALTTTNGTVAIGKSKNASEILIGSFLNISTLCKYLSNQSNDVLLLCAGWKGRFSLEDTVFAGAVADRLMGQLELDGDDALAAHTLFKAAKFNLSQFLGNCSHANRLKHLSLENDLQYCLRQDEYKILAKVEDGIIQTVKL